MRKKSIAIFILVIIVISMSLTGCADFFIPPKDIQTPGNSQNSNSNSETEKINFTGYIPSSEVKSYTYEIDEESLVYSTDDRLSTESNYEHTNTVETVESVEKSVVKITIDEKEGSDQYASQGSGVIFAKGSRKDIKTNVVKEILFIMTCAHVLTNPHAITVRLNNKDPDDKKQAVLVGGSEQHDIAVISIEKPENESEYTIPKLRDAKALVPFKVGEIVIAIGTPVGLDFSVTKGIISGEREIKLDASTKYVLQIDAAVNPGNSGGPLFDNLGRLCGIVVAKNVGTNIDAIGYAIKIVDQDRQENGEDVLDAISVAEQLIKNAGTTDYVYGFLDGINEKATLGITVAQQTDTSSGSSKVFIQSVSSYGSVAWFNAQTKKTSNQILGVTDSFSIGEQINKIDNINISTLAAISTILKDKKIGDLIVIKFISYSSFVEVEARIVLIPNIFGNTPREISQTAQK